jgi:hypothetical protein
MRKIYLLAVLAIFSITALAQAPTASVSGKVVDPTGAVIPGATVTVTAPDGKQSSATSDQAGAFHIQSLPAGTYSVSATAQGFSHFSQAGVVLTADHALSLDLTLQVHVQDEKVSVQSDNPTQLDIGSSSNAGSLVIKDKDLEALSDDPDELQSELQALAGPSAGPNGGQIYIDGFTGGQLPPKSAIREIRINQNPFSAQYDKLGYGRIEILTKPGSDKYHGQFFFNDNNAIFNSRNPFVHTERPSYNTYMFDGNLGGPINKKSSFFFDASRRNIDEFAAINAIDPNTFVNINELVPNPRRRTSISPRLDYQLTQSNTLTARYQFTQDTHQNSGLGQFSLPSQAYDENETEHSLQISDTQILSPQVVNETRFQWEREVSDQLPFATGTQIQVQGAFTTGGNSQGRVRDTGSNYEFQNYTSISHGKHLIKFGGRLRAQTASSFANQNFNGTFIFSPVFDTQGNQIASALQAYQNAIASPNACNATNYDPASCPTQFSITTGTPQINVNWVDAGLYAEDEWRLRPNVSLTYGLRFETQNAIHDHGDFAPRLGLAWGLGGDGKSAPKTVLRAGFGMFYDRFGPNLLEQSERLNGVNQVSSVYQNPTFYPLPAQLPASSSSPTIYQIAPNLRAPYTTQSAVSIERQISKAATVSVTYLNSRGEHGFYIQNINAPDPNLGGARADAAVYGNDNVYQYASEGVFRQNQLIANARLSLSRKVSLFGFYTLGYANSNIAAGGQGGGFGGGGVNSVASFLSHQFDPMADYGRAAFDVRHRAFIGGSVEVPYGFRLSPFIIINSGQPYTITTGQDNNGDSIFNDRAWLNTSGAFYCTSKTDFTGTQISPSQPQVPVNTCSGPGNATVNLRLAKTFGFGRESKGGGDGGFPGGGRGGPRGGGLGPGGLSGGGGGGNPFGFGGGSNRRYSLTLSIMARNLLNSQNPGLPVGSLSSPFFGQTISIAGGPFSSASANRRIDLQIMFSF